MASQPSRGDVWRVILDPTVGREIAKTRPCVVISTDEFNHGPAGLAIVVPVTSQWKGMPLHVEINPPEGGLDQRSFAKPEDIRSLSTNRLQARLGQVSPATLTAIEDGLRIVLKLDAA